ncbi:hypothetical protein BO85DRAFT_247082 [Aspergillus piperis CBS 112811]|uniref:Uncharacterized protein n=1 Tax=Aspergillus piperis CBS 112811 TaxID=1448313 RepID=A0A8G1R529_9EURO|nr:hypothetical protein BO85DRAFT_247082 [Aspergillus piperis CBS 112811]RAH59634.1 hypothetical protein BO85DRAFT_247082 [Aspergillus piperis CBS 112811]
MVWIDKTDRRRTTPVANGEPASQPASQPGHTPSLSPSIPRHPTLLSFFLPSRVPREKIQSDDVPYLVEQYPFKIATTNHEEWMGMARWLLLPRYLQVSSCGWQTACFPGASELVCVYADAAAAAVALMCGIVVATVMTTHT